MKTNEELDVLIQALEANLKILNKITTSDIKNKNLILLSIMTELKKMCNKVIPPLKENIST